MNIIYLSIYSFLLPLLNSKKTEFVNRLNLNNNLYMNFEMENRTINKTINKEIFKNIHDIEYDNNEDLWIIDLNTGDAADSRDIINFNMEREINITNDDNFPSFYKFLREREINELNAKEEYLQKRKNKILNKTKNIERYSQIEPSSKDLKLLSSFSTMEWAKTWLYEMVHVPDYFPTFMYQDMFRMREFGQKNNTKNFFYIGYFPKDVDLSKGPYYIGAFELVPPMREFRTYIIIQNPYYCIENIYDNKKIKDFKKELMTMCNDSMVFFKFSNLKDTNDQRYFYSWLYEE